MSFPMVPKFHHSNLPSAAVFLLGLFVAQCIATLQVYVSDIGLHRTLLMLKEAGYLIIPNQRLLPRLLSFESAFRGGLFFTLSIGVFLTFLSWSAAWAWDRLFSRNRLFLFFCLLAWVTSLVLINGQGFCILITLYFLFIPVTVFAAAVRLSPQRNGPPGYRSLLLLVPLLLLALLWTTPANSRFFLDLRDRLLLSTSLGTRISDFYYEYAYYPAEVFKSLNQKLLKSCSVGSIQRKPIEQALERTLIVYDYLPVDGTRSVADLVVREDNDRLLFQRDGKTIVKASLQDFMENPGKLLEEFSRETDICSPFRRFTLFSLLVSLPLAFYTVCFSLFYLVISFVLSPRISAWIASFLCLVLGTALFFYVQGGIKDRPIDPARDLASDRWETRVAALKLIEQKKLEVGDFEAYPTLIKSRHVAERYWLVRTLGSSRRTSTYRDLLGFLEDSNPGVVSMAFYALGQRRDPRAVPEILKRIETSDDWYNQWYAYKALRTLGWKQSRSK